MFHRQQITGKWKNTLKLVPTVCKTRIQKLGSAYLWGYAIQIQWVRDQVSSVLVHLFLWFTNLRFFFPPIETDNLLSVFPFLLNFLTRSTDLPQDLTLSTIRLKLWQELRTKCATCLKVHAHHRVRDLPCWPFVHKNPKFKAKYSEATIIN